MNDNKTLFRQTNAFAMTYGLILGLWGMASLSLMVASMGNSAFSLPAVFLFYGSPVFAGYLAVRFRRCVMEPAEGLSFGRVFLFTFMMGVYASVVIAILTFFYLYFIDGNVIGMVFENVLQRPEIVEELNKSGVVAGLPGSEAQGPDTIIEAIRAIPPAGYSSMIIYMSLMVSPIISAIVALIVKRSPRLA